jgi:phospholipid/cholesterol/gamma-HCH transport system substrate-binding protein
MNIKFNKFERVAGLFVVVAIMGSFAVAISVAIQKGWFAPKVQFSTVFKNADGVHSGTSVQIAGLHAGSVDDVELQAENKIKVSFTVLNKFAGHIRQDSKAQLVRPFIIGERVLEVTVGNNETPLLAENSLLPSSETLDLMTVLSDKKLSENMETVTEIIDNLKVLVNAFTDKGRTEGFIRVVDKIEPLINNLNDMSVELAKLSKQATKHENLATVLENANLLTKEINTVLPMVKEKAPGLGRDMTIIVTNLAQLTEDFKKITPALVEIMPSLPKTGRRTVEFIDEFVVLLKALQKSMLLKSNAEEVREEEALSAKKVPVKGVTIKDTSREEDKN